MTAFASTQFCDCQTLIKTFEKGAAYCTTSESTFALLTPALQNYRVNAQTIAFQNELALSSSSTAAAVNSSQSTTPQENYSGNMSNMDKVGNNIPAMLEEIVNAAAATTGGVNLVQEAQEVKDQTVRWLKECAPCDFSIWTKEGLKVAISDSGIRAGLDAFEDAKEQFLNQILAQIKKIREFFDFNDLGRYVDLCNFLEWMFNYVCLPDLAKIVAILMARLSKISFDISANINIIVGIVAPFIQPFLTNLCDALQNYILLVVKPIDCIIDSLIRQMSSLDFENAILPNLDNLTIPFEYRRQGEKTGEATFAPPEKAKILDKEYHFAYQGDYKLSVDLHDGSRTAAEFAPFSGIVANRKAQDQADVEAAYTELEALNKEVKTLDQTNPALVESFNKRRETAQKKYNEAVDNRDKTAIQRGQDKLLGFREYYKSLIAEVVDILKDCVRWVEAYFNSLWEELQKLLWEFGGGHNTFLVDMLNKAKITELIEICVAVIKLLKNKEFVCDEDKNPILADLLKEFYQDANIRNNEDGSITIEQPSTSHLEALDEISRGIGVDGPLGKNQDLRQTNNGDIIDAGQKLKSLIELTGDPVLDTEIAKTTEALTSTVNITFKCPLQTSVANAEQINKWINELNQE